MPDRLSKDQERAITALLTCPTISDAAGQISIHPNTLRRWIKQPAFSVAYAAARAELLGNTINRLQHALFAVTHALVNDLGHADPSVRHRAAELLLDSALRGTEQVALAERVASLEAAAKGATGK